METIHQAWEELQDLHRRVVGTPAPEIQPSAYLPFPPGVDPVQCALEEARRVKRAVEAQAAAPLPAAWVPAADVYVGERESVIRLEVPGVEKDDLTVLLADNQLIVRGERKPFEVKDDLRPVRVERPSGRFERRFALPAGVQSNQIRARYHNGVLEIRLTREAAKTKSELEVEVA